MTTSKKNTLITLVTLAVVTTVFLICQVGINTGAAWMSSTLKGQLVNICAWIMMAVSLNLVVGISGELSLGHAGFMSVGAFTAIIIASWLKRGKGMEPSWLRFVISAVAAVGISGLLGFLIGIPVLRLRGDYLAIVTLAFGQIISNVIRLMYVTVETDTGALHMALKLGTGTPKLSGKDIIKGAQGAMRMPQDSTFIIGFILVIITLIVVFNLTNSRSGRAIKAIRDNRIAAEAMGLKVTKYKLMAFVTGSALAGLAGALYGLNQSSLQAGFFEYTKSIEVLVYVVLGGIGTIPGSIVSATALTILPEVLRAFSEYRMLIYAVFLILVMILTNNPLTRTFFRSLRMRIFGRTDEEKRRDRL